MDEIEESTAIIAVDLSDVGAELSSVTAEIENAFRETSSIIANELKSAARSGQADFSAMAQAIAAELAALALERVFSQGETGLQSGASTIVNVSMPATQVRPSEAGGVSTNALASVIAQAVRRGGRFL